MRNLILFLAFFVSSCSTKNTLPVYHYGKADRKKLPAMTLLNHNKIMKDILGEPNIQIETIGILVYDGVNTLEAIAPMAVFSELMKVKIEYVGLNKGTVKTTLADIKVGKTIYDIKELDLLVIPGGNLSSLQRNLTDAKLLDWIKQVDITSKMTASVGTGTLIAGKAGILEGKSISLPEGKSTENAKNMKALYSGKRYSKDGKYYTSVQETGALDLCLFMIGEIAGKANLQGAMLDLEYDPQPPAQAGGEKSVEEGDLKFSRTEGFYLPEFIEVSSKKEIKNIGILAYEDFFTLDAIGPLVVLSQLSNVSVKLLYKDKPEIKSGRTYLIVNEKYTDARNLDVLIVPGGSTATWALTQDTSFLEWIRNTDQHSQLTASVCTGSWVLGAAGLLKGRRASTNWFRAGQMMKRYDAVFTNERFTIDGKYWTSAGVSAGIDMSFGMIEQFAGQNALKASLYNLAYFPEPPAEGGSPEKTDDLVLDMMHQMYDYLMAPLIK